MSIRGVANAVGTTTRAVYSLFGSKQGLMDALGAHAFALLRDGVGQLPALPDPIDDLVEAGLVFRRFVVEHPSLFRIAFGTRPDAPLRNRPIVRDASIVALNLLKQRIARLADAGLIDHDRIDEVTFHFDAVCEGLAAVELRENLDPDLAEPRWREGLAAIICGLATAHTPVAPSA